MSKILSVALLFFSLVACSSNQYKPSSERAFASVKNQTYDGKRGIPFGFCQVLSDYSHLDSSLVRITLGDKPHIIGKKWIDVVHGQRSSPFISDMNFSVPQSDIKIKFYYEDHQLFTSIRFNKSGKSYVSDSKSYFWSSPIKKQSDREAGNKLSVDTILKSHKIKHEVVFPEGTDVKVLCQLNSAYFTI